MADRAHVSSVDTIEAFRANLIAYLAKARPLLEDAADEVSRTRQWLAGDQELALGERRLRVREVIERIERELLR